MEENETLIWEKEQPEEAYYAAVPGIYPDEICYLCVWYVAGRWWWNIGEPFYTRPLPCGSLAEGKEKAVRKYEQSKQAV